jgi:hypothetical protein
MIVRLVLLAMLVSAMLLLASLPVEAQIRIGRTTYIFGPTLGDHVESLIDNAAQGARQNAKFAERLDSARQRYWAVYPKGAGFAEAEAELQKALFAKDLHYLNLESVMGSQRTQALELFTGGPLGGGIPKHADRAFARWVQAFAHERKSFSPEAFLDALEKSWPVYLEYARARDLEEFVLAGRMAPGFDENGWYLFLVLRQEPDVENDDAAQILTQLSDRFGEADLYRATKEVRAAADANLTQLRAPISAPPQFGGMQDQHALDAILHRLAARDTRSFVFEAIRSTVTSDTDPLGLKNAAFRYQRLVEASGEPALLSLGERIAAAPKEILKFGTSEADLRYYFYLVHPEQLGCEDERNALWCMERVLLPKAAPVPAEQVATESEPGLSRAPGTEAPRRRPAARGAPAPAQSPVRSPALPPAQPRQPAQEAPLSTLEPAAPASPETSEKQETPEASRALEPVEPVEAVEQAEASGDWTAAFEIHASKSVTQEIRLDVEPEDTFVLVRGPEDSRFTLVGKVTEFSAKGKPPGLRLPGEGTWLLLFRREGFRERIVRVTVDPGGDSILRLR